MVYKRRVSIFLAVVVAFVYMFSSMVYITTAEEKKKLSEKPKTNDNMQIVKELVEKREPTIKHFELSDGTFEAVCYTKRVHYEDNGVFKEIDNRMYEIKDKEGNEKVYQNTENDFKVQVSKNLKSNKLVRIEKDGFVLSWGIKDALIDGKIVNKEDFKNSIPNYKSHDIFFGVDDVLENRVKYAKTYTKQNGIFENAPYHGKVNNPVKNKAPIDGQAALDNSLSIGSNTTRRVGISEGEFVILDETTSGLYHGHVRAWDELSQIMQSVLRKAGMVTKKGKIK